jgi:hypothetical protein
LPFSGLVIFGSLRKYLEVTLVCDGMGKGRFFMKFGAERYLKIDYRAEEAVTPMNCVVAVQCMVSEVGGHWIFILIRVR